MPRQVTVSRAYVAPAARVRAKAAAVWLPPKSTGSAIAVASGAVAGVEYVRVCVAVWPAATATEADPAASRKMAPAATRLRVVSPTAPITLSPARFAGPSICGPLTPALTGLARRRGV